MNGALTWTNAYEEDGSVKVHGRRADSTIEVRRYLQTRLRERLRASSLRSRLEEYVREVDSTGFAGGGLTQLSESETSLEPWEIGEVLAEVLLEDVEGAFFPWPPSWDKRVSSASLPGPDLVGFVGEVGSEEFVFGEAKTSDAADVVNSVIYGDDGLRAQVERLLTSEERRSVLIGWLLVRAESRDWKAQFDRALTAYAERPSRARVVGVLLSGSDADPSHLAPIKTRCVELSSPFAVSLVAFYFPIAAKDWAVAIEGTEDQP